MQRAEAPPEPAVARSSRAGPMRQEETPPSLTDERGFCCYAAVRLVRENGANGSSELFSTEGVGLW